MHVFDESFPKYGDPLPTFSRIRFAATRTEDDADAKGNPVLLFNFEDLCPDCVHVVDALIKRIRLEEDEKPKKKAKKAEAVEAPVETPVEVAPETPAPVPAPIPTPVAAPVAPKPATPESPKTVSAPAPEKGKTADELPF